MFAGLALAGCASGPREAPSNFIVFFSGDSTTLTPDGRLIVKTAATKINAEHPQSVLIAAGAKAGDNMELSEPRFAAVRQALVDQGVKSDLVARAPIPPGAALKGPAAQTGDQRVEIRLLANGP